MGGDRGIDEGSFNVVGDALCSICAQCKPQVGEGFSKPHSLHVKRNFADDSNWAERVELQLKAPGMGHFQD